MVKLGEVFRRLLLTSDGKEDRHLLQLLRKDGQGLSETLGIHVFHRMLHYLHEYRFRLILACLCSAVIAGLTATLAWLVRPFLDGVFLEKNHFLLVLMPIVLLCLVLLKAVVVLAQDYLTAYVSNWITADIRHRLYEKLIHLPITFHDVNSSARLVARIMNDAGLMGLAIPQVIKNLIQQVLTFLALTGVLLYQEWRLGLVLFVLSPIAFYGISQLGYRIRHLTTRCQQVAEDMTFHLKETFSEIRVLKAYNKEDCGQDRFVQANREYARMNIITSQISSFLNPLIEILGVIGVSSIITYGGHQVINGNLTQGTFYSFMAALILAYDPIRKLGAVNKTIQASVAAGQRVFAILDLQNEEEFDKGNKVLPRISESMEFCNVTFSHNGTKNTALKGINLRIQAGEVVALVGKTGSGKTTLANLILRFYEPDEGTIFIDGENIRNVTLSSLRKQIAIVAQETILFDDTVKNNIAYSRSDATEKDIIEAAQAAYALEFIEKLPQGFDTIVGEKGIKLSGGQRQRIAIARAILRNPPILILDEATSSLDSESERIVQQALTDLMKNRTSLVIAHRLSTIQNADRIVVLHQGCIVGCGRHEELLDSCMPYQRLYPGWSKELETNPITM